MASILEFLLFLSLITPKIHSQNNNVCTSSFCGEFQIDYPFKLQGQQPGNNCSYINLTCTTQETSVVLYSFPFAGDFYVRDIRYYKQQIVFYDPSHCLAGRLLNNSINLSSTPFSAPYTQTYFFYTCPKNALIGGGDFIPIDCLSNPLNLTIAARYSPHESYGCNKIGSSVFPVMYLNQYDYQGFYDLPLYWEVPDCQDCDPPPPPPHKGGSRLVKILKSAFMIPSYVLLAILLVSCCMHLTRTERNQGDSNNSATATAASSTLESTMVRALPGQTMTGIDESRIECYTEMVIVGENKGILGQGNSSCAICLEAYKMVDRVRRISKCGHFFHSDCIVLWLEKNTTCPVCRTELTHVQV